MARRAAAAGRGAAGDAARLSPVCRLEPHAVQNPAPARSFAPQFGHVPGASGGQSSVGGSGTKSTSPQAVHLTRRPAASSGTS